MLAGFRRLRTGIRVSGVRRLWLALGAGHAVALVLLAQGHTVDGVFQPPPIVPLSLSIYSVISVVCAIRVWRHRGLDPRSRRAWGLIAISFLLLLGSSVLRVDVRPGAAFPSPADLLRLLSAPVFLAGLLTLPLRTQGRRERQKVWLDTLVVVISSAMLLWYTQTAPGGHVSGRALAAAVAYPAFDLMLIFGASVVLLRGAADSIRLPAMLLGAALLLVVTGDALMGYQVSRTAVAEPHEWQFACWISADFLLVLAAGTQWSNASRHLLVVAEPAARLASRLPYLAIGGGHALLLVAVLNLSPRIIVLVLGTIAITAVVVYRQVVALRENHELATTDTLTGLVNRRQFYDVLRAALARTARTRHAVAVLLIDLNDFKQVNDVLGHRAGDELLIAVSQILRRNVLGLDTVARLGGDEFAVVLHNVGNTENAVAVVRRIATDLGTPVPIGEALVQPGASIGVALSGVGDALAADEIIHRADVAMYEAKAAGRAAGGTRYAVAHDSAPTLPRR